MKSPGVACLFAVAALFASLKPLPPATTAPRADANRHDPVLNDSGLHARIVESYGRLPLSFEPNWGQSDPSVRFLSRGAGYTLYLTSDGAILSLSQGKLSHGKLSQGKRLNGSAMPVESSKNPPERRDREQSMRDAKRQPTSADALRMQVLGSHRDATILGG